MKESDIQEMYDRQAGTYTTAMEDAFYAATKKQAAEKLAGILDELAPDVLLDAGTGEATTLVETLRRMKRRPALVMAFDIVPNRVRFAKEYARTRNEDIEFFISGMTKIPMPDKSVDVVTTFHAIEPNGGFEPMILNELNRVCRDKMVLVEPSYELASKEAKARMERLGYCRDLARSVLRLSPTATWGAWGVDINKANPAAVMVVPCSPHGLSLSST